MRRVRIEPTKNSPTTTIHKPRICASHLKPVVGNVFRDERSMVINDAALGGETLPAGSVTTEEMDHTPSLKVGRSQLLTEGDTTYVHDTVVPSAFVAVTVTEFPSGTVPADIDGVVSDVRLSVDEAPVSEASSKSGTPGVEADVAIVNGKAVVLPVFPERSVIVALTDHSPSVRTPNVHVEATPTV